MPNQQYIRTKATLAISINGMSELFTWAGNRVTNPGFTAVMHWRAMSDELLPVTLEKNVIFDVLDISAKEGITSPPSYLTESDLISLVSLS